MLYYVHRGREGRAPVCGTVQAHEQHENSARLTN